MNKIEEIFGEFKYESNSDGSIKILGNWAKDNIVKVKLGTKVLWCHKLIKDRVIAIYEDLKRFNLEDEFDLSHGGGSYVPRHKSWNPRRGLSLHSWGIAIDINPKKYPYGSATKNPPAAVILAFEKHGFEWGGDWRTPDPMHFERRV